MSPTNSRHHDDLRRRLIETWETWDESPGNETRARTFNETCAAYAGRASNELHRYLAAARRARKTRRQALTEWEDDW